MNKKGNAFLTFVVIASMIALIYFNFGQTASLRDMPIVNAPSVSIYSQTSEKIIFKMSWETDYPPVPVQDGQGYCPFVGGLESAEEYKSAIEYSGIALLNDPEMWKVKPVLVSGVVGSTQINPLSGTCTLKDMGARPLPAGGKYLAISCLNIDGKVKCGDGSSYRGDLASSGYLLIELNKPQSSSTLTSTSAPTSTSTPTPASATLDSTSTVNIPNKSWVEKINDFINKIVEALFGWI
jgi:hypothetical protein